MNQHCHLLLLTPVNHTIHLKEELKNCDLKSIQSLLDYYHTNHLKEELKTCDIKQPLLDWIYYYFGDFSQSTACISTRFRESSSTLLDKFWYTYSYIYKLWSTYSYIYKPTTTIWYRICTFLNSQHTSLFRLLSSFKLATTSASTPLFTISSFTTHNTLQLLVLFESASASFLPITLSTSFVDFIQSTIFLYLAGINNEKNDPDSDLYFTVATTQITII